MALNWPSLNCVLTWVGFRDAGQWKVEGRFTADIQYRNLVASPYIVAFRHGGVARVVNMQSTVGAGARDRQLEITTQIDARVALGRFASNAVAIRQVQPWLVMDGGELVELPSVSSLEDALTIEAFRIIRWSGLSKMRSDDIAQIMADRSC
ncbi:MAG: hypothetical protein ACR2PS_08320 [Pseudomonadales bacterium]